MQNIEYCVYIYHNFEKPFLFNEFYNAIHKIYYLMHDNAKISDLYLTIKYFDIEIEKFNVMFRSELVLYNNQNKIKVSSLFPLFIPLDISFRKKITKPEKRSTNIPLKIKTHEKQLIKKSDNSDNSYTEISHELRTFEADKNAYYKIKDDISKNIFSSDQINPMFIGKYYIFLLLESRNQISMNDNTNLQNEYECFKVLYDPEIEKDIQTDNTSCEDLMDHLNS